MHKYQLTQTKWGAQGFLQDVQYITWDQNCAINAGFISESVRSVCKDVKKDVRSSGEGGGGASGNSDCKGVAEDAARPRVKVCLREENPRDVDAGIAP